MVPFKSDASSQLFLNTIMCNKSWLCDNWPMDKLEITGSVRAVGSIDCGGAKNLCLKLMIAAILNRSITYLDNIPNILDVIAVMNMSEQLGVRMSYNGRRMMIDATQINGSSIKSDSVGSRMSILYLGILGHFSDDVRVPLPRGCNLGARSIDIHIQILKQFGFKVDLDDHSCRIRRTTIRGIDFTLAYPSVGATETALFLSVLAEGKSILRNIAIEPEINHLIAFLQHCGAHIYYSGDRELTVIGVNKLHGCTFKVAGDRIEAAGWACLACATDGEITVNGIGYGQMHTFLGQFTSIGGGFKIIDDDTMVFFRRQNELNPISIETGPYPQFPTDCQPFMSVLMAIARGESVIHETLFNDRLSYLSQLGEFGVKSTVLTECAGSECRFKAEYPHTARIYGGKIVAPSIPIKADTIRSGFAYVIAASVAHGTTTLINVNAIRRGFGELEAKLKAVGVMSESIQVNKKADYAELARMSCIMGTSSVMAE